MLVTIFNIFTFYIRFYGSYDYKYLSYDLYFKFFTFLRDINDGLV